MIIDDLDDAHDSARVIVNRLNDQAKLIVQPK
jgi:hypothetical protein